MRESLLEVLAEPRTGASLDLKVSRREGDDIVEGELRSKASGETYPIVRGIPRFVPPSTYVESFGKQWNLFRTAQLDSETGAAYSRKRFDNETKWDESTIKDKLVLDAGCGAGRFAEVAASRGARLVALDMSSAVDATRETLRDYPNAELVQADLLNPPFKPGAFDFAYSIGVLQHTPDPPGGVISVVRQLKRGGRFTLTIYARRPWTKLNAKYLVRPLTRRLPQDVLLRVIETTVPVLYPVVHRLSRVPVLGRVSTFTIPIAVYDRPHFTPEERVRESVLDTFDMLAPRYDAPMTAGEVERALETAGASSFSFQSRVPVVVNGVR